MKPWTIFIPLILSIFTGCTTDLGVMKINEKEVPVKVTKVLGVIPVKTEKLPTVKEAKDRRLEERLYGPVSKANRWSLYVGLAAVAGCCIIQSPAISGRLGQLALAAGVVYITTLGVMMLLNVLASPWIRFSIAGALVIVSAVAIRKYWKKGL